MTDSRHSIFFPYRFLLFHLSDILHLSSCHLHQVQWMASTIIQPLTVGKLHQGLMSSSGLFASHNSVTTPRTRFDNRNTWRRQVSLTTNVRLHLLHLIIRHLGIRNRHYCHSVPLPPNQFAKTFTWLCGIRLARTWISQPHRCHQALEASIRYFLFVVYRLYCQGNTAFLITCAENGTLMWLKKYLGQAPIQSSNTRKKRQWRDMSRHDHRNRIYYSLTKVPSGILCNVYDGPSSTPTGRAVPAEEMEQFLEDTTKGRSDYRSGRETGTCNFSSLVLNPVLSPTTIVSLYHGP